MVIVATSLVLVGNLQIKAERIGVKLKLSIIYIQKPNMFLKKKGNPSLIMLKTYPTLQSQNS